MTDEDAYISCRPEDRWVFDKLLIANKAKVLAAPREIPVPSKGEYIVRPIYNLSGLGLGASKMRLTPETSEVRIPLGYFWSEVLEGVHLSVDYTNLKPSLTVQGIPPKEGLVRWRGWAKIDNAFAPELPKWLTNIATQYKTINIEYIGGKVIEVHLRGNPDPFDKGDFLKPVYEGDEIEGEFVEAPEPLVGRLGFIAEKTR